MVAITSVSPQVLYRSEFPTRALKDGDHAGFSVEVTVHLEVRRPFEPLELAIGEFSVLTN